MGENRFFVIFLPKERCNNNDGGSITCTPTPFRFDVIHSENEKRHEMDESGVSEHRFQVAHRTSSKASSKSFLPPSENKSVSFVSDDRAFRKKAHAIRLKDYG